ncbi:hypothetical protein KPHES18084_17240 [Corynebacterium ulcerans]|nr:hypothetical protein CULTSU28_18320 [Corynebacterium ulcerans]
MYTHINQHKYHKKTATLQGGVAVLCVQLYLGSSLGNPGIDVFGDFLAVDKDAR